MNLFKNWTIGGRINLGFAVILLIMVVLSALSYFSLQSVIEETELITETDIPLIEVIAEISELQLTQAVAFEKFLRHAEEGKFSLAESEKEEIINLGHEVDNAVLRGEEIAESHGDLKDLAFLQKIEEDHHTLEQEIESFLGIFLEAQRELLSTEKTEDPTITADDTHVGIFTTAELELQITTIEQHEEEFEAEVHAALLSIESDTDEAIAEIKRRESSANMQAIGGLAVGLFLGILFAVGISKTTSNALRGATEQISSATFQLSSSSQQTSAASQQNASIAQQVAAGATQQSKQSEEISKSVSDMAAAIQQMSASAQEAAATATKTSQTAQVAGESSEKIAKIVDTITSISEQTNLLALNATIEAARAGEAGRGFAVVADEVRKLAESANISAIEIKGLISDTGEQVSQTVTSVEQVAAKIQEVSAAIQQQSSSIEQIAKTMDSIAAVSQQNSSGAQQLSSSIDQQSAANQQVAAAAQQLQTITQELNRLAGSVNDVATVTSPAKAKKLAASSSGNGHFTKKSIPAYVLHKEAKLEGTKSEEPKKIGN